MTSSVTSSQSAVSYRRTSRWYLQIAIAKRCRLDKWIQQRFGFALRFSRWFCDDKTSRFTKAGCQLLSLVQMLKTTKSQQNKGHKDNSPSVLYRTYFKREEFVSNGFGIDQLLEHSSNVENDKKPAK
ncbi:hypothetical protein F511_43235 [Dorcoceras hygrometricum]|uniref:Uncharacterized protein n=1 Tax=Dorcoceras hygrometricum TaxID=472368 RepID=A0A2Z7DA76_9LAMI|nr:hypothetical protein F511_43235 [Dorcoceras hygrometricum]